MSFKVLTNYDFAQNQLLNAVAHKLSAAPSSPAVGQQYYNTTSNVAFMWNGAAWRPFDAAALTDGTISLSALATNPLARANHTGTQLAATVSDLATTVRAYTLDTFAAPAATISFGNQKAINVGAGVSGTDGVNYSQVVGLIAAAVTGQTAIKNPAKVYAAGNVTLSGLQTIDGVTLAAGDRVLAANQTTASQNNLYVVASGAWSVAADATPASQWLEGTEILIAEGTTYSGAVFCQYTQSPTLTTLTFIQRLKTNTYTADGTTLTLTGMSFAVNYGVGLTVTSSKLAVDTSVVARKYSTAVTSDGSTLTYNVTHNLGTGDVIVQVYDNSSGALVGTDVLRTGANTVTIGFGSAPASGTVYRVTVIG